jgi:phage repressor protein C with HTH and peptisase S24 domain
MLTHAEIWNAIDTVAARSKLSASGLAKRAGLDPTTFNKSKRIAPDGRQRWPSTESVAKVLDATKTDLDTFTSILLGMRGPRPSRTTPLMAFDAASRPDQFDSEGRPQGPGWDEVAFPTVGEEPSYAIEVTGGVGAPVYRDGDILLASPHVSIRRGDRVLVHMRNGKIMIMELRRRTPRAIDIAGLTPNAGEITVSAGEVSVLSRILWASQ